MIHISRKNRHDNEYPQLYKFASLFHNSYGNLLPYYKVEVEDDCWSRITVSGSLEPQKDWINERFYNSQSFIFMVESLDYKYHQEDEQVSISLIDCHNSQLEKESFSKYIGTPQECATKMKQWLVNFMSFAHPDTILPEIADLIILFENPCPEKIPYYQVTAKNCEHWGTQLLIKGSLDPTETWPEGRLENSRCFAFVVSNHTQPYYHKGDKVYVTPLFYLCNALPQTNNFLVHVGEPEECAADLKVWLEECINN